MRTLHHLLIPLRDGTALASDLYLPDAPGRYPLLLFRTPYGRGHLPEDPLYGDMENWTQAGYAVCAQDVRGTGDSQGQLGLGGENEFDDGADVVRYLAAQPYCNGRVGMFGLSFPGFVQLAAAASGLPTLRAICPFMCPALHPFGAHRPQVLHMQHLMWAYGQLLNFPEKHLPDPALRARLLPELTENARRLPELLMELPLVDCSAAAYPDVALLRAYRASVIGVGSKDYWAAMHMPIDFSNVSAGLFFATGWLDVAKEWTIDSYLAARKSARGPMKLLIGPWPHTESLPRAVDGTDFGPEASGAAQDVRGMMRRWFDRCLRDMDTQPFPQPVRFFMLGSNTWHDAQAWPPERAQLRPCYLSLDGSLQAAPDPTPGRLAYTADPDAPTPSDITDEAGRTLLADWSLVSRREDVLYLRSAPLTQPLWVAGTVRAELYAVTDAPDADFVCRVLDIDPAGRETALCVGMVRASVRHGGFQRQWVQPGQVVRYCFDAGNLANCFQPGHRIGIHICSFLYPYCDRNLHTQSPIGQGARGVKARQQLCVGAGTPSAVYLPILPET